MLGKNEILIKVESGFCSNGKKMDNLSFYRFFDYNTMRYARGKNSFRAVKKYLQ